MRPSDTRWQSPENPVHTFFEMFVAPRRAFDAIHPDYPLRLPMLLLAGAAFVVGISFALSLDVQASADAIGTDVPELRPDEDTVVAMLNVMLALVPVFTTATVLLTLLAFGFCLWIVGKLIKDGSSFRASMSLACWASVPGLTHSVAATVAMPLTPQGPTNLEELLLNASPLNLYTLGVDETTLAGIPSIYSLTDFWIMGLVAIGYQRWYRTHVAQAIAVAIIPFVVLAIVVMATASIGDTVGPPQ